MLTPENVLDAIHHMILPQIDDHLTADTLTEDEMHRMKRTFLAIVTHAHVIHRGPLSVDGPSTMAERWCLGRLPVTHSR